MGAGVGQVIVGTAVEPAGMIVTVVEAFRVCGVVVAAAGDVPAGVTSIYAACTVRVPAALAFNAPEDTVPNVGLDTVNVVPELTSCVVPSLRWATACKIDAPPTLSVAGVAVTDREARF